MVRRFVKIWAPFALPTLFMTAAAAGATIAPQVGRFVAVEGDVRLFKNPSKTLPKNVDRLPPLGEGAIRVLFEHEFYEVVLARPGMEVQYGNIVRTAPGAKALLVFPNGDHFTVAPSTAYRAFWSRSKKGPEKAHVSLLYGRLRGVVSPSGPRRTLRVRAQAAVLGVRGTDFYIGENTTTGDLEVSVQRGKVWVTPAPSSMKARLTVPLPDHSTQGMALKTVEVNAGKLATLNTDDAKKGNVEVVAAGQNFLAEIHGLTRVDSKRQEKLLASLDPGVVEQVVALQQRAVETTLLDVQQSQPEVLKSIGVPTLESLNSLVIRELAKTAPVGAPRQLPEDLSGVDPAAVYDRFFK
jgi:hypothetical protein